MKHLTIIIALILLAVNCLLGFLLSGYEHFNVGANCAVIVINAILIWLLGNTQLKDGFRYSLGILYPIIALIEFLCIAFCKPHYEDNVAVAFVLIAIILQIIILIIANYVSKNIQ